MGRMNPLVAVGFTVIAVIIGVIYIFNIDIDMIPSKHHHTTHNTVVVTRPIYRDTRHSSSAWNPWRWGPGNSGSGHRRPVTVPTRPWKPTPHPGPSPSSSPHHPPSHHTQMMQKHRLHM